MRIRVEARGRLWARGGNWERASREAKEKEHQRRLTRKKASREARRGRVKRQVKGGKGF